MEGATLEIFNRLTELNQLEAADLVSKCSIENIYKDTMFELGGGESETDMYDVVISVPPDMFKSLKQYSAITAQIEEAIRENSEPEGIHVRRIDWKAGS